MKYAVVLGDGMAGWPLEELGGRTTLEAASTPVMDRLARTAQIGLASMVPEEMAPGSDTANLSVLGYDPRIYYTGRSPLEALSIGVDMAADDVSFRCNLVTLSEEEERYEDRHMLDHSSDEISTEDAAILLADLKKDLEREGYTFYAGTSYRHLLVWKKGQVTELVPPHDILTKRIGAYLPEDAQLREMMERSYDILSAHPLNLERKRRGLHPANSAWFWGAGTRPRLASFSEKTGMRGVMISAVDLLKGLAAGAGMDRVLVEGANGGLNTNYEGKADAAAHALLQDGYDFAYIHVEAPDEMGHQGSIENKIRAIEYLDGRVIGRLADALDAAGEAYRLLVLPDHPTPIRARTHTKDPVPYLLYDSRRADPGDVHTYGESAAAGSSHVWPDGYRLLDCLLELDQR
ncbi:cofactor-independent phosphoglycerate mutase [Mordavella massiliensis]|uniref:Cofactor-independent phosphoglycerate mutase n=1 Tax=Mordavella massiliensis TaxID=1871024 RepID=A0A938XCM3_9CLOT|nr:cofactor-independent phosphoglycerate mutase [Mordavella massiliensis]MBM6948244.1 cofactor-independent phosphoglycerate mutase [Mordavella massiliensis]